MQNRVTITLSAASKPFVGFSLVGVINMDSARRSGAFGVSLLDEKGQLVDSTSSAGSSIFTIMTGPDVLQSVTLSNSNKTVGGYGRLTVTLVTGHGISGDDEISIAFPKWDAASTAAAKV